MKIFMSLAALSIATGLWLGSRVSADQAPSGRESSYAQVSGDAVLIGISANSGRISSTELSFAEVSD